jgi:hypothetical protein
MKRWLVEASLHDFFRLLERSALDHHPETKLQHEHRAALDSYRAGSDKDRSVTIREALSVVSRRMSASALATLLEAYA